MSARESVLVLSEEPMIAALVGLMIEVCDRAPAFAQPGEGGTDALGRLLPIPVVLVGVELPESRSDTFFALAARSAARVVVFGPASRAHDIAEIAATRGVAWFTVPPSMWSLAIAIGAPLPAPYHEPHIDRRSAVATVAPDGTPVLVDRGGVEWIVYDRRTPADRPGGVDGAGRWARLFVSASGRRRSCEVVAVEGDDHSAAALEDQLGRANED